MSSTVIAGSMLVLGLIIFLVGFLSTSDIDEKLNETQRLIEKRYVHIKALIYQVTGLLLMVISVSLSLILTESKDDWIIDNQYHMRDELKREIKDSRNRILESQN